MRLDRFLSMRKFGSRSDVTYLIKKGVVTINGIVIKEPSLHVDQKKNLVVVDGVVVPSSDAVTLMMNKPQGVICANHDELHKTVIDLIQEPYSRYDLKIAGRLDIDTEGLVILTTDGNLVHQLISPRKKVYKTYFVGVDKPFGNPDILNSTYEIKDGDGNLYQPQPARIKQVDSTHFYLSIVEGKFHQVKRMVQHFRYEVTYLKRISIGDIKLDETLKLGEYKEL